MITEKFPGLKDLSPEEKLALVGELWEELSASPDLLAPRDDHRQLLRERLEKHREQPDEVIAWEEVKKRLLKTP